MGPFCHDGDFRRGIPDLASDRGLDHCGVGEVSADSIHSGSCSWRITPEPASLPFLSPLQPDQRPHWLTPDVILILFLPALVFEGSARPFA
jgi:hypothetical protein